MSKEEKEFFDTLANENGYDVNPETFYEVVIQNTMRDLPSRFVIMDVGCGSGAWSSRIAKRNCSIIGIDISSRMVKTAHQKLNRQDFFGICCSAENLPLKNNIFDCVFFGFSLHHIPNISSALQEASRCLRSSGLLILVEPNGSNPVRMLSAIFGRLFNKTTTYCFSSPDERPLNIHFINSLLEECKLADIHISLDETISKSDEAPIIIDIRDFFLEIASRLFPGPCGAVNIIITARKTKTCC